MFRGQFSQNMWLSRFRGLGVKFVKFAQQKEIISSENETIDSHNLRASFDGGGSAAWFLRRCGRAEGPQASGPGSSSSSIWWELPGFSRGWRSWPSPWTWPRTSRCPGTAARVLRSFLKRIKQQLEPDLFQMNCPKKIFKLPTSPTCGRRLQK